MRKATRTLFFIAVMLMGTLTLTACDETIMELVLDGMFSPAEKEYKEINKKALDQGDPEICWDHEEDDDSASCIRDVAVKLGDPDACRKDPDYPWWCYTAVAEHLDDPQICMEISEKLLGRGSCLGNVAVKRGDANVCLKVEGQNRSYCWNALAKAKAKPGQPYAAVCDTLESNQLKLECVAAVQVDY